MKKLIIIGGGIAGLSAGITAQKAGMSTIILEKNAVPGGQCTGWDRQGCHIDDCIHWLTGAEPGSGLYALWEELGALGNGIGFVPEDKFYTSELNGQRATLWNDKERTRRELIALSPEDENAINDFIADVARVESCQMPVNKPMDWMTLKDYLAMGKTMGDLPKVMKKLAPYTIVEYAARFKHPLIRTMMQDYMPGTYQAFSLLVSYATFTSGNGAIPVGGSRAMSLRIAEKYKSLGGDLRLSTPVKRIVTQGKLATGVELQTGEFLPADYVISAADAEFTFRVLLEGKHTPKKWADAFADRQNRSLFSGLYAAFMVDKGTFPQDGVLLYTPKEPIIINGIRQDRLSARSYDYEPNFAPEGKSVVQVCLMQHDQDYYAWKKLTKEEYKQEKQRSADQIQAALVARFPETKQSVQLLDCWTPLTFEHWCNAHRGAYMSFILTKNVKSFSDKGILPDLKNVLLGGQWLSTPGGLPTAAAYGKFAAMRVLRKEKLL